MTIRELYNEAAKRGALDSEIKLSKNQESSSVEFVAWFPKEKTVVID